MPTFSQSVLSDDRIRVDPARVWEILVDPLTLARLTPLVEDISVDGARWRWRLTRISGLGMTAAPEFTTLMRLDEGRRIDFQRVAEATERASAEGFLTVTPDDDHTVVAIDVTATVELPLPAVMDRPVRRVMFSTMKAGGSRFARNMLRELGDPPHRGLDVRGGRP